MQNISGALTIDIVTLSITKFSITTPNITTLSVMTHSSTRHERHCLEIFVKPDELERSSTETPFNEILTDWEKVGKSWSRFV